jgi:hypothetical protein
VLGVVLLSVDAAGLTILLAINGVLLALGELSTAGAHVGLAALQAGFLGLQPAGFRGRQLAAPDSLPNASLLGTVTAFNSADRRGLALGVVFLAINLFRKPVLLALNFRPFLPGELAIALHLGYFFVNGSFLPLEPGGFGGSQLAALDALSDALLLKLSSPLQARGALRRRALRECQGADHQGGNHCNLFHALLQGAVTPFV